MKTSIQLSAISYQALALTKDFYENFQFSLIYQLSILNSPLCPLRIGARYGKSLRYAGFILS
ncbi:MULTISPECIES: hypothetical protein [unclassified Moorena]|uniref:hypothetical protein n=1 Tax=unclassified Moorena TaxID=2683338 RepID=UPI0003164F78|nr:MULTISPECIES: hypothetical protein [unclassified Moorena]NEP32479.1 hypothetical protein [Moorena sp. SIO3B2]NEQ12282.1 hypothetical protein [Moorena sp. SIO4E2]NEQ16566.1 hypothetical protein [Moorena sp. SIO3E2]NES41580.1 hypothetical protein [Moorena sp. SIO2C4]